MLRDPQLLLAYRQGSEEAFLALYERYSGPLRRFLQGGFSFSSQGRQCRFRGTDTSMDVESLVQETFARAFAKTTRENYDGIRPFQTYLFSIAKNLVLRECHHRDRLIVVDYVEDSADGQSVFSTPNENGVSENPEQRVANKQLEAIMTEFIGELTTEERRLFQLRFAKGYTQEASAEMMHTTRARIKLLEKNVRKRFLDRLKENGYFTGYVPNPRWKRQQTNDAVAVG